MAAETNDRGLRKRLTVATRVAVAEKVDRGGQENEWSFLQIAQTGWNDGCEASGSGLSTKRDVIEGLFVHMSKDLFLVSSLTAPRILHQ